MAKTDTPKSFDEICARLDEIVDTVRNKDTTLERSLDLFDEAISLGSAAVEMVDKTDFSASELELLEEAGPRGDASNESADVAEAEDGEADTEAVTDTSSDEDTASALDTDLSDTELVSGTTSDSATADETLKD